MTSFNVRTCIVSIEVNCVKSSNMFYKEWEKMHRKTMGYIRQCIDFSVFCYLSQETSIFAVKLILQIYQLSATFGTRVSQRKSRDDICIFNFLVELGFFTLDSSFESGYVSNMLAKNQLNEQTLRRLMQRCKHSFKLNDIQTLQIKCLIIFNV